MVLALVAHLDFAIDRNRSVAEFAPQRGAALRLEFVEHGSGLAQVLGVQTDHEGLRRVDARIGKQHADRRKIARLGRNDNARNVQGPRQFDAMQRAAAAVAEQRKVTRVVTAGDRDLLDDR